MKNILSLFLLVFMFASCGGNAEPETLDEEVKTITPVTVCSPDSILLNQEIVLNATSTYLLKIGVKATINGYIQSSFLKLGQNVGKGQKIFVLKTKEAKSLGNTINKLDPTFNFSGLNPINSPVNGFVTNLNHKTGDYVQDGEQLVEIADRSSFGFIMNLPYEYHLLLAKNNNVNINLPDGRVLKGLVAQIMPTLDSISQTQKVMIKVLSNTFIPENLIATIAIVKKTSTQISLPKESVLSDETQQNFWVMQMINDSTAVKIPIKKGIEAKDRIEILSPMFNGKDKILRSGNYGLADTALVKIKQ